MDQDKSVNENKLEETGMVPKQSYLTPEIEKLLLEYYSETNENIYRQKLNKVQELLRDEKNRQGLLSEMNLQEIKKPEREHP